MSATLVTCVFTLPNLSADSIAIRNILLNSEHALTLVKEYYDTLLELKDVEYYSQPISPYFNVGFLGKQGSPIDTYPAYDTVLLKSKFKTYQTYIKRVIATEEARMELGIGCEGKGDTLMLEDEYTSTPYTDVKEFIDVLEKGITAEVPVSILGWIWALAHPPTRDTKGVRVVRDISMGTRWNSLLGTNEFPDIIIARRITPSAWKFRHSLSEGLIVMILEWWCQAYGMSPGGWVLSSEDELDRLYDTFRFKGETIYKVEEEEKIPPIFETLSIIEETILGNPTLHSPEDLLVISSSYLWKQWTQRMLRQKGIPLDVRTDLLMAKVEEWTRDGWGIRKDKLPTPTIPSCAQLWDLLIKKGITEQAMSLLLRVLEANDPAMTVTFSKSQKEDLVNNIVPYALSIIKSRDSSLRVKTADTHQWIRNWILQFLPSAVFEDFLINRRISSILSKLDCTIIHSTQGYYYIGIELPALPPVQEEVD